MDNRESPLSSSSIPQFQLVDLNLPPLNDQNIKAQVEETHTESHSLVLRQPLLDSISRILRPTTNFIDSVLLEKKECGNEVELDTTNNLELNPTLSELDALLGHCGFSTRALLKRQKSCTQIESSLIESTLVKFSSISELKTLAGHEYFMYPTLLMEETANNAVQRFDEINLHTASMELLKFLSKLSWDAKAINTMCCFVLKFLEFLGFLLHGPNQPIAEIVSSMVTLKESPISLFDSPLEKILVPLDQLNNLIKVTSEVIEHMSTLALLSDTEYDKKDLLSTSGYWAILSLVICYIQIVMLMQNGEMALELSNLLSNLSCIMKDLKHYCKIYKLQIEEMEVHLQHIAIFEDAFSEEKQSSNIPIDMSKLMKSFMYSKDNCHSLIDGSAMSEVGLEVLRDKAVIFFISDLNVDNWQLESLQEVHKELKEEDYYKIVWVPFVLKWNEELKQKFEDLKSKMPWYVVSYDLPIAGVWYFKGRQIFFNWKPSYLIIDLHHGNQYPVPSPDCIGHYLHIVKAEHSPFKQVDMGAIILASGPPSVSLIYKVSQEEGVSQKKPSSGFQGLVAMSSSKWNLINVEQKCLSRPQATKVQEAISPNPKPLNDIK